MARFPHIPREAVLKEDLLRTGFAFDESALTDNLDGEIKPKSYFIFSFDQKPLAELGEAAKRRPPEEVALTGGPYGLRRTIVSVRDAEAKASNAYTLTGGSVTSKVDGLAEADFYGRYAQAIEERFPKRWIGKVVAQALPREDVQRYKDYGITIYHPNYEVWDKRLFSLISPGKQRYVGREEWHRRIFDAAEVFGARYVIPNFVAGVEMARPFGFETVDGAIASTTEGLDYFMSRGITPRFTTWCPEPTTPLGRDNPDGAPLEYHVRLLEAYRGVMESHGLEPPPGYGPAGPGNAVFSVSSFMDTLDLVPA